MINSVMTLYQSINQQTEKKNVNDNRNLLQTDLLVGDSLNHTNRDDVRERCRSAHEHPTQNEFQKNTLSPMMSAKTKAQTGIFLQVAKARSAPPGNQSR